MEYYTGNTVLCDLSILPGVRKYASDSFSNFDKVNLFLSPDLQCMAIDCHIGAPEEFVLSFLHVETIRKKYDKFIFRDYIKVSVNLLYVL